MHFNKVPAAFKGCRMIKAVDSEGDIAVGLVIGGKLFVITWEFSKNQKDGTKWYQKTIPQTVAEVVEKNIKYSMNEFLHLLEYKITHDFIVV